MAAQPELGIVLEENEVKAFVDINKAVNTVRKTRSDIRIWCKWCNTVGENRELEVIPSFELNKLLCSFLMTIRKKNGDEYEPCSLTSLLRSIDRQLRDSGSLVRILDDREFESSRKSLKQKGRN